MSGDSKAFICGCAGLELTPEERDFIAQARPWGLILFRRNIGAPAQVAALAAAFRALVGRADAPVLVDQEGGRVQRLGPPHWRAYPSARTFARLADPVGSARLAARLMAADLAALGVTVDCAPVLDTPAPDGHSVIGDRAYADEPAAVAALGRAVCEGLLAGGVLPVVKHIPGHGRARADSHHELPVVEATLATLERADFAPFRALRAMPLAMTAHVVYAAIDPAGPGTTSAIVVERIIRGAIGFDGLLLSDDLSMKALSGDFSARAAATFAAGVDVALHCNGDLDEARAVADATPPLAGRSLERANRALALIARPLDPFDLVDAGARLDLALAAGV